MKLPCLFLPIAAMAALPAFAEDGPHTFTGNVGLTSDYLFRGISQTGHAPAIQGGFDYAHASGFYLGAWASNVGWIEDFQGYDSGKLEIDLYGGFRDSIGDTGVSYDVGVIGYVYPGDRPGGIASADTAEVYIGLGWKWFTAKYAYTVSNGAFGFAHADGSHYLDISASLPLGETGLTAGAHWGAFEFENNGAYDYEDWKVSLTYDMGRLGGALSDVTLSMAYSDSSAGRVWTDVNGERLGDGRGVVWVSKIF